MSNFGQGLSANHNQHSRPHILSERLLDVFRKMEDREDGDYAVTLVSDGEQVGFGCEGIEEVRTIIAFMIGTAMQVAERHGIPPEHVVEVIRRYDDEYSGSGRLGR